MRGWKRHGTARWNGGVTKYEIEPICSSGLCESPGPRRVPQGTPFEPPAHFRHPSYLHSLALSPLRRERKRETEREKASSSRYHKSFEVLIRSHTRRLFRVWHPPDLGPHVENYSKISPLSSRCTYLICLTARARSESHDPSTTEHKWAKKIWTLILIVFSNSIARVQSPTYFKKYSN